MGFQPSMEQFHEFCAKQPPTRYYQWADAEICACAQYAETLGYGVSASGKPLWTTSNTGKSFWIKANEIAQVEPHTFGALRARIAAHIDEMRPPLRRVPSRASLLRRVRRVPLSVIDSVVDVPVRASIEFEHVD